MLVLVLLLLPALVLVLAQVLVPVVVFKFTTMSALVDSSVEEVKAERRIRFSEFLDPPDDDAFDYGYRDCFGEREYSYSAKTRVVILILSK